MSGVRFVQPLHGAEIQIWAPPAPADRILAILSVPGRVWQSRGGPDEGTVYHEAALLALDGPADAATVIIQADGSWSVRGLLIDGRELDARRFVPQILRDRAGQ